MIHRLVFENLKHRPIRTLLSVFAIGVQVTMILTLVGLSEGVLADLASRSRGTGADVIVRAPDSSALSYGLNMPEKVVDVVRKMEHVTVATGALVHPIGGFDSITGIDADEFTQLSGGLEYLSGGPFHAPNDLVVSRIFAQQKHLQPGSTFFFGHTWNITGIVEEGKLSRTFADRRALQSIFAEDGKISVIYLKVDNPDNIPAVLMALQQLLPDYKIYSMEEFVSLFTVDSVQFLRGFTNVVIIVASMVGFLAVFQSMYTAVLERTREIGILKAMGASPGYILSILLWETVVLAMAGTLTGVAMTYGTRALMAHFAPSMPQQIVPVWYLPAAGIALVGSLIGATYPGLKAARQDAIEALAYETEIEIRGLTKVYHVGEVDVHALRGVDLHVERGEFVAIVGPSGSGKSTLFHILGGLAPPTAGTVTIDGRDLLKMNDADRTTLRKTTVGFIFQKYNLLPTLTAADNIEIARHIAGKKREPDTQFDQLLNLLGIASRLHHKPRALSGGEQQRVAIARALVNHPALVLADEPTGNLDTENSTAVLGILRDLNKRLGQTILMITHNPEAAAFADRIVTMRDGRIV